MKTIRKLLLIYLFLIASFASILAQESININDVTIPKSKTEIISATKIRSIELKGAQRVRPFFFNPKLRTVNSVGTTFILDFFDNKQYKATVENLTTYRDGVQAMTAKIEGYDDAFCYMSISNRGIYLKAELPSIDEQFIVGASNGETFLQQYKITDLNSQDIPCGGTEEPASYQSHRDENPSIQPSTKNLLEEPITVTMMVAYTAKAKLWADNNVKANGIDNYIAAIIEECNRIMANSGTGVTIQLVNKYQVDYVEGNTQKDLSIFNDNPGVLAQRAQYKADIIALLADISHVGGQATPMLSERGDPKYSALIVRVQQALSGYTFAHEVGHIFGNHHCRKQKNQVGPGVFPYSNGWRDRDDTGKMRVTVMSYQDGIYYEDGITAARIPYYSDPDKIVYGVKIGDAKDANATLTIKRTKSVISRYGESLSGGSTLPKISITSPSHNSTTSSNTVSVTASASATSGNSVSKVEFYLNGSLKTTDTSAPYSATLSPLNIGLNSIIAKVIDNKNQTAQTSIGINYSTTGGGGDGGNAGGESCSGVAVWEASKVYNGGDKAFYNGYIYTAAYWTQNNRPDQNYGAYGKPWKDNRVLCQTAPANTPPTVSITSPANNTTVTTNSVNVTANAAATTSGASVSKVEFYLNGVLKGSKTASPYSLSVGTLNSGSNVIMAKVTDSKGQTAENAVSITYNAPVVNTPPTISITSPSNGSTVTTNSVNVTASAAATTSGASVSKVEFYLNGVLKGSKTASPYSLSVGTLNSGSNVIMAKVTDSKGQTAENAVNITYNAPVVNTPPTIAITQPENGDNISSATVNVYVEAQDADGFVEKVEYYLNGRLNQTSTISPSFTGTSIGILNRGENNIVAKAYDNKGLTAEASVKINPTIPIQNTPPTVSISSPVQNATVTVNSVNVTANATATTSGATISKVEFYLNGSMKTSKTSAPYSATMSPLNTGSNVIKVKVIDNNEMTAESTVNVNYTILNVPSKVENIHAANTTTNSIELAWNPSVGPLKEYGVFDGTLNKQLGRTTDTKYLVTNLKPNTSYKFYVRGYNQAGESSDKSDVYTTKTKGDEVVATPPTISITSPSNGSTVTANSVNVAVNANATTSGATVSKVDFYLNGVSKGSKTASPYTLSVGTLNSGSNVVMAKVTDSKGQTAELSVNITYNAPSGGGTGNCMGVAEWVSTKVYNKGDKAQENGIIYEANQWTQNNRPSQNIGSGKAWTAKSKCDGTIDASIHGETQTCGGVLVLVWKKDTAYDKAGIRVVYNNNIYESRCWTQGTTPTNGGAWILIGQCK